MKKLLILTTILMAVCSFVKTEAQTGSIAPTVLKSAGDYSADTVTSTSTEYLYLKNSSNAQIKLTGFNEVSIVGKGTEISGTTSGSIRLEASLDSVTWYPYYLGIPNVKDTTSGNLRLDMQDVTGAQTIRFYIPRFADAYIRLAATGGGSTNWRVEGKLQARKLEQ